MLRCYCLQFRLNADIVAYFREYRLAVRSRILLCLIVGSPPLAHKSVCSTVKLLPQSHLEGIKPVDGGPILQLVGNDTDRGCGP